MRGKPHGPVLVSVIALALAGAGLVGVMPASPATASLTTIADGPVSSPGYSGSPGVYDIEPGPDGSLIIGGIFNGWGPQTGGVARFDAFAANLDRGFPWVIGTINAIASDGNGGHYIGGDFTNVRGVARTNVAHVLSDGSVNQSWAPNPNGVVNAIAVSEGIAYVGGAFTTFGGESRNRLAAINAAGVIQSWDPNANGTVNAITIDGSYVYVGGAFTGIGGFGIARLAAVNTAGAVQLLNPAPNGAVNAIAVSAGIVYFGGAFTTVSGLTVRNRLAAVSHTDPGAGVIQPWNPNANGVVNALAISGTTVYIGGEFQNLSDAARLRLGAVDTAGALQAWDPSIPDINTYVKAITVSEGVIYVAGNFSGVGEIGAVNRPGIVALTAAGAIDNTRPTPRANGEVRALSVTGASVVMGGTFTSVDVQDRRNLLAIDANGALLPWNPWVIVAAVDEVGEVRALHRAGNTLYVGGRFTFVIPAPGAVARSNAAALDVSNLASATPVLLPWNPDVREVDGRTNYRVRSITASGSTVFIGGTFNRVGGTPRSNLAAVDGVNATLSTWAPEPNGAVFDMTVSAGQLWIAGEFTLMGGQARSLIAAMNPDPAAVTVLPWSGPALTRTDGGAGVFAMLPRGDTVFAGGRFDSVAGGPQNSLVALDAITGAPRDWRPNPTTPTGPADVWALSTIGEDVYVGGDFETFDGQARAYGAAVNTSLTLQSWNPGADNRIYDINQRGSAVLLGGLFRIVTGSNSASAHAFFAFTTPTPDPGPVDPPAPPAPPAPSPAPSLAPAPSPPAQTSPAPVPQVDPIAQAVDQVRGLTPTQVRGLTAEQLAALPPQAFAVMTPAQIRALQPRQVRGLSREQIRAIQPQSLRAMQPRTLNAFQVWQIRDLTDAQVTALRTKQVRALGPTKKASVQQRR